MGIFLDFLLRKKTPFNLVFMKSEIKCVRSCSDENKVVHDLINFHKNYSKQFKITLQKLKLTVVCFSLRWIFIAFFTSLHSPMVQSIVNAYLNEPEEYNIIGKNPGNRRVQKFHYMKRFYRGLRFLSTYTFLRNIRIFFLTIFITKRINFLQIQAWMSKKNFLK